jgi:TolA-binding protein
MYAEKIEALSPRVAYNLLRLATKGRPPAKDSVQLYRRLAMLQHHFGNTRAARATLESLYAKVPDDDQVRTLLDELLDAPSVDDADSTDGDPSPASPQNLVEAEDAMEVELDSAFAGVEPPPARSVPTVTNVAPAAIDDEAVEAARTGPTIAVLAGMIGDSPCDLGNIEVFYRLGLACLAQGRVDDAIHAFQAVSDASPGYRDTESRLARLAGPRS